MRRLLILVRSCDDGESCPLSGSPSCARAYCAAQGRRLPTQDEWEFAARADATRIDASTDQVFLRKLLEWYAQPSTGHPPSVEKAVANVYGLRGLHGLAWEWVHDFNSAMIVGGARGEDSLERKLFCGAGSLLASDVSNYAAFMRYAFRSSLKGNYCVGNPGFRTAMSGDREPVTISAGGSSGASPFDLTGKWRTQDNKEIGLRNLKGKVRVLTMGFTSCQYACPRIVGDLQRIEPPLGTDVTRIGFVFVSIDSVRDTPEKMAAFAAERKLDPLRWTILSGSVESVRELAVTMAYKYQQVEQDFAHSNLIAVSMPAALSCTARNRSAQSWLSLSLPSGNCWLRHNSWSKLHEAPKPGAA